ILKIAQDYARHVLVPSMVAAMEAAGTAPAKAASASEASPATQEPATLEDAPAAAPPQSEAVPGEGPGSEAAALLRRYGRPNVAGTDPDMRPESPAVGREAVLAAFGRARGRRT